MKRIFKILIVILSILLLLGAAVVGICYTVYERYGFLFYTEGEYFSLRLASVEVIGGETVGGDMKTSFSMRYDSSRLQKALKNANYRISEEPEELCGELIFVHSGNKFDKSVPEKDFLIEYDRKTEKVYLIWKNYYYEVTDFEEAREAIQDCLCQAGPNILTNTKTNTFFWADHFSKPASRYVHKYENYKNTEAAELDGDADIIAHARNEVIEGYEEATVYREEYGDRYAVEFEYPFRENNIVQLTYVIMSDDGRTEWIEYRVHFLTGCIG